VALTERRNFRTGPFEGKDVPCCDEERSALHEQASILGRVRIPGAGAAGHAATRDIEAVRADFPRVRAAAYLDNASCHLLSVHSAAALHRYMDWASGEI
jgi:hypothetical protein